MRTYLDTSALVKRYVNEPGSEDFDRFLQGCDEPLVSTLVVTELQSVLERHRREAKIEASYAGTARELLREELESRRLRRLRVLDEHVVAAGTLMLRLETPLRTLDALHLAICEAYDVTSLATADGRMIDAATELELAVTRF